MATSPGWFNDAIEGEWLPFTAKMILKSSAEVVPIYFPGQNSRWFQWANKISSTIRQGLLLHEIVYAMYKKQSPIVGNSVTRVELEQYDGDPRGLMYYLRNKTLQLKK